MAWAGVTDWGLDDWGSRLVAHCDRRGTLVDLRAELGAEEGICLLLGADAFAGFLTWHRPDDILGLAHLVVMRRPGDAPGGPATMDEKLTAWAAPRLCSSPSSLTAAPAGRIWFQDVTPLAISAPQIRRLVALGKRPRYLLPDAVIALIAAEGLYR